jgi:hypothetical protein
MAAPDRTQPDVNATIGGKAHALRFDKRALFRLGAPEHAEAMQDVDVNNGAALFRRACIYAFCMLTGKAAFGSAEELAAAMDDSETEPLMDAINRAIEAGQSPKGEAADPLSGSGPSPAAGSA